MRKAIKMSAVLLALSGVLAFAQTPPPDPAAPAAALLPTKREQCRAVAQAQGLKAQAASDQIQICVAQARLDCTKEAVAQAIPNTGRRDFIRTCVNGDH